MDPVFLNTVGIFEQLYGPLPDHKIADLSDRSSKAELAFKGDGSDSSASTSSSDSCLSDSNYRREATEKKYVHVDLAKGEISLEDQTNKSSLLDIDQFITARLTDLRIDRSNDLGVLRRLQCGYHKYKMRHKRAELKGLQAEKRLNQMISDYEKMIQTRVSELHGVDLTNAVQEEPFLLQFFSVADQDNEEIVRAAIAKDFSSLRFASERLRELLCTEDPELKPEVLTTFNNVNPELSSIKRSTILKAIITAFRIFGLFEKDEQAVVSFDLLNNDFCLTINHEKRNIHVVKDKLGEGHFGQVYLVQDIISGLQTVFKRSKEGDDNFVIDCEVQLVNEQGVLHHIFTFAEKMGLVVNGKIRGIQNNIHFRYPLHTLEPDDNVDDVGTIIGLDYYNKGSLKTFYSSGEFASLAKEVQYDIVHQLLSGLAVAKMAGLILGDVKDDNMLVNQNSDGTYDAVLADFGGAQKADDSFKGLGVHTRRCVSQSNFGEKVPKEKRVEYGQKNDVFAMGIAIYQLFSNGDYPCKRKDKYPININQFDSDEIPAELEVLLRDMIVFDPERQISIETALQKFEDIIKAHVPALAERLFQPAVG